jgi:hypothetical protein
MGYKKILVDNTTCMRRFHLTCDDGAQTVAETQAVCQHCNQVVFSKKNHPPVTLVRDENLIQSVELSEQRLKACQFGPYAPTAETPPL